MAEISATEWQALSPLLDELLEAQGETRAQRLAQIRRTDAALAVQLETLLDQRTAVERDAFLEGAAFSVAQGPSLAGQTIGAYTLSEQIGHGGMGSVWRAERSDGRYQATVAVKFLNLALLGRGGVERFAREGNMLARLSHPNIARLLDAGVTAGNQPYLVLEYIDGVPIDAWCDEHSLGIEARLRLFLDVLAAIAHAHSNLILHRDLKPSNILVTREGRAKLLDFGIGKLIADQSTAASPTELTHLAGRAFTPDFAAPEQITQGDVTTATDVYALGVLLYLLLTGQHPTVQSAATQVDRLRAVVEREPGRPSDTTAHAAATSVSAFASARATTPHKLSRALRGDLDNILAKALKKSPAERYQSANAFAADLRHHLNHEPISARGDALGYRVSKFARRYRVGVSVVTLTGLILIAGIFGTAWQAQQARQAQSLAEDNAAEARTQREAAQFEARIARANQEFVSQLFGDAMRSGETAQMRIQLDRARELLRRRYADDPVVHSLVLFQLAGRYAELQDAKREEEVMQEVEKLGERARDPALSAAIACIKAYDLIVAGKNDAAKPYVGEGLRLLSTATRSLSDAEFECYRADAMLASATGDIARGVARMLTWLGQLERDGVERTRLYLNSLGSLAYIQHGAGELQAALATSRRARALNESLGSEATLSSQIELRRESMLLFELGRISEAIAVDAELFQRFKLMQPDGAAPAQFLLSAAGPAIVGGDADDAVTWLRIALLTYERAGPEMRVRRAILDLASAYVVQQNYTEANATLRRFDARKEHGSVRPGERVEAGRIRVEIAQGTGNLNSLSRALDELEIALAVPGVPRLSAMRGLLAAGLGRLALGDGEKARIHATEARRLAASKVLQERGSAWIGAAELLLARIAWAEGERTSAKAHLASASAQFAETVDASHRWNTAAASLSAKL